MFYLVNLSIKKGMRSMAKLLAVSYFKTNTIHEINIFGFVSYILLKEKNI